MFVGGDLTFDKVSSLEFDPADGTVILEDPGDGGARAAVPRRSSRDRSELRQRSE